MVTILLKQKADPNCRDIEGNTPLHMACEEDRTEVAQILVENEADLTLLNKVCRRSEHLKLKGCTCKKVNRSISEPSSEI